MGQLVSKNLLATKISPSLYKGVYVLEGAFTIEVQDKPAVTLNPGEMIEVKPKQVHEVKNLLDSPTKVFAFGLGQKGESFVFPVK